MTYRQVSFKARPRSSGANQPCGIKVKNLRIFARLEEVRLLDDPDVAFVSISNKQIAGEPTGEISIQSIAAKC